MAAQIPPNVDLCAIPLGMNPNGSPMNLKNPPSLAPLLIGLISCLMVFSSVCVLIRIATSLKKHSKLFVDDYFSVAALVINIPKGVLFMTMDETARHIWDVPICWVNESWLKRTAAFSIMGAPGLWCIKVSIFALYMRLFGHIRWMRISCWAGIVFFSCVYLSMIPVYLVFLIPHGGERWSLEVALKGKRADPAMVISAVLNLLADIYLIVLPLPIVAKLKVSTRRKIGLCAVFMTGLVTLATAAVNVRFRVKNVEKGLNDSTWDVSVVMITDYSESSTAIIISCVPALVAGWQLAFRDSNILASLKSLLASTFSRSQNNQGFSGISNDGANSDAELPIYEGDRSYGHELHPVANGSLSSSVRANKAQFMMQGNGITKSVEFTQKIN